MTDNGDKRLRAYQAGARFTRERMEREAPLDAAALRSIEAADVLVVPGNYDHVELVLDALGMPYTMIAAGQIPSIRLRPEQLVVVNCPGRLPSPALRPLRGFVEAGGSLFTTDWALKLLENLSPGMVRYNQNPTADDVVRIEIGAHDNPFLRGVIDSGDEPVWWLEGSSYPITVLDPRVEVLIRSHELGGKYGEPAVAVTYRVGQGEVFHMISHYYLQRTETRSRRHSQKAAAYAAEKNLPVDPALASQMADLNLAEVESAASSSRLFANIAAAKKRANR